MRIAVVGAGYMGGGIAQVLAVAGHDVALADANAELARANHARLLAEAKQWESEGLFAPGSSDVLARRLRPAASIDQAVADAEYIEEAVPEKPELKRTVLAQIEAAARPGTVIGSNTSTLQISSLAPALDDPSRFLGVHFSNPAPFIPGVEVIPHEGTSPEALGTAVSIVEAAGKETARVRDVPGFVLNRLQYVLFKEAATIVEEGVATAADVDTLVRTTFGFRLPFFGPFAIADMAGLDVYGLCFASLQESFGDKFATPEVLQDLLDRGRLGAKSGGGFLDIAAGDGLEALVAYRTTAYARMGRLLAELGPAPGVGHGPTASTTSTEEN